MFELSDPDRGLLEQTYALRFRLNFGYLGPVQVGPANPLYPEPTGLMAKMVGFSFDDINGWTGAHFGGGNWEGKYPPEVLASQFEKMVPMWQQGLDSFKKALGKKMTPEEKINARKDYQIAEAAGLYFKSTANQIRFILARNKFLTGTSNSAEREELIKAMKTIAADEFAIAKRFFVLARDDSRFGWEASNHYKYFPYDFIEKTIDCDYILNDWLAKQDTQKPI